MAPSGKWIEGIDPDGSVEDAARRSLEARLTAVNYWLPLAAHLAEQDIEHVHRLRVSTRRAVAALELYWAWLPEKPRRWLKKQLRKIRRAAGDARDLDVLAGRLEREYGARIEPLRPLFAAQRAAVQPAIAEVAERSRREDRFVRRVAKLLAGVRPRDAEGGTSQPFREWAGGELAEAATRFCDAAPSGNMPPTELHAFRIAAKALRYTMELVAPAFGPELRKQHYPRLESLQERLGEIQDHQAAVLRLRAWAEVPNHDEHAELLRALAGVEEAKLSLAVETFRAWWTPEKQRELASLPAR